MNRSVLVLGIAALFAFPARAQDSSIEEAKAHAARAKVHYDLGEYEKAAEEYIVVYRIKPLPALLYNIAQSYRQAGQYDKARQFYKSYLREAKDAPNRDAIEKAIREIDELLAKEKRAKDGPPKGVAQTPGVSGSGASGLAPPATATGAAVAAGASHPGPTGSAQAGTAAATSLEAVPASSRTAMGGAPPRIPAPIGATTTTTVKPAKSRTLFWVTAGASAAALAAGGIFGLKTLNSRSSSDAGKANLLYGIGGGLAAVSGALLVFDL
jgi:tetratricopeptide (TPR) repeat protein